MKCSARARQRARRRCASPARVSFERVKAAPVAALPQCRVKRGLSTTLVYFVLLFLEVLVALRRILEIEPMADQERGVDLAIENQLEQLRA